MTGYQVGKLHVADDVELLEYAGQLMPAPRFHTPRDPDRPTRGTKQGKFARVWLRKQLMPWQQLVADVSGELNDDGTARYPLIVCTVQRQAGKSDLDMTMNGERCLSRSNFRAWYTAQTGSDARDQFLKFAEEVVTGTPLDRITTTLRGNGHEVMKWPNGSTLRPHPPTEDAMHGKQSDRSTIDEGWAFLKEQGQAILQAVGPTQLTRPGAQVFIWSAGGTASSTWLAELVDRGRRGDPTLAYFEWAIPDDMPLDDLQAIAERHPAYGHTIGTQSIVNLRSILTDDGEFARAAGNRWTEIIGGAIPADQWESVRWTDPIPEDAPIAYGAARAADGSSVALVAAAELQDCVVVELLDVLPAHGAAAAVDAWASDGPLAVDRVGPSANLADALTNTGRELVPLTTRDATAACANLIDALAPKSVRYRQHPDLDAAVKVAAKRRIGDGGWVWARSQGDGVASTAPLEAATLAVWAVGHRPAELPAPETYWGAA